MKTTVYNPSPLELEFAKVFKDLRQEIQNKITDQKIREIQNEFNADNPTLIFKMEDKDGSLHEIVIKFIQRIEE